MIRIAPPLEKTVRSWDLAATEPSETNPNPDWTCGVKMGVTPDGRFVVTHVELARKRSDGVRQLVLRTAGHDTEEVTIRLPQDPAQAGVDQKDSYAKLLAGFTVVFERETGSKETRADPFAAQWQAGNVDVVIGDWNADFFAQLEGFPSKKVKDDAVDGVTGAFRQLLSRPTMWEVL